MSITSFMKSNAEEINYAINIGAGWGSTTETAIKASADAAQRDKDNTDEIVFLGYINTIMSVMDFFKKYEKIVGNIIPIAAGASLLLRAEAAYNEYQSNGVLSDETLLGIAADALTIIGSITAKANPLVGFMITSLGSAVLTMSIIQDTDDYLIAERANDLESMLISSESVAEFILSLSLYNYENAVNYFTDGVSAIENILNGSQNESIVYEENGLYYSGFKGLDGAVIPFNNLKDAVDFTLSINPSTEKLFISVDGDAGLIIGSEVNDVISGLKGYNEIHGLGGNDIIYSLSLIHI